MTKSYAFRAAKAPVPEKVPRVARLLALAHKFQGMLDRGEVESMAELGRLGRVSRARITQIMDLMMLAPEIQEDILHASKQRLRLAYAARLAIAFPLWAAQISQLREGVGATR